MVATFAPLCITHQCCHSAPALILLVNNNSIWFALPGHTAWWIRFNSLLYVLPYNVDYITIAYDTQGCSWGPQQAPWDTGEDNPRGKSCSQQQPKLTARLNNGALRWVLYIYLIVPEAYWNILIVRSRTILAHDLMAKPRRNGNGSIMMLMLVRGMPTSL